jgi:type II secretory pathway component PulM
MSGMTKTRSAIRVTIHSVNGRDLTMWLNSLRCKQHRHIMVGHEADTHPSSRFDHGIR